uniref:dUTP diphosphatase n=1 Tax=Marseillevirus LCMAC101 TaxID=2506602 RepID=A0A481YR87_9VIRU|nr:MAG: uncharacterized protein LCMAC101_02730 [Marseillevirus LCMAC101]
MESADRTIREKNGMNQVYIKAIPLHPQAEIPVRENEEVGWTITLIGRTDNRAEDDFGEMNGFCTGLQFCPPTGYYLEVIALPDLYKHGYNLASGAIVIGPGNKDELIIPLMKFRECNDLELPIQAVQVLVKKVVPVFMSKVKSLQPTQEYGQYMPPPMSGGYLPPNPMNPGYKGDMEQYQAFAQSQQGRSGKRPVSARPQQNHMF